MHRSSEILLCVFLAGLWLVVSQGQSASIWDNFVSNVTETGRDPWSQVGIKEPSEKENCTEEGEALRKMLEMLNEKMEMAMKKQIVLERSLGAKMAEQEKEFNNKLKLLEEKFSSQLATGLAQPNIEISKLKDKSSNATSAISTSCRRDIPNSPAVDGIEYESEEPWIPTGGKANITCVQSECQTTSRMAECVGGVWEFDPCKITSCSLLLIGGRGSEASLEWFHPWSPSENRLLPTRLLTPREGPISAVLADGTVLIAGGWGPWPPGHRSQRLSPVELLDLQRESLSQGPSMENKRVFAAAVAVDGVVFVCGGHDGNGYIVSSCERFQAGNWSPIASIKTKRWGFALAALDTNLYAIGGWDRSSLFSVVEAYDIQRDVWTTKSPMPTARDGLGAAVWGQSIVACGGWNEPDLSVCEKYDVGADSWTAISPMNKGRYGLTLSAVGDWLVAVGDDTDGIGDSAELYSPNRDQWTLLSTKLKHKRCLHSAVVV